jgi:hypothetical protein
MESRGTLLPHSVRAGEQFWTSLEETSDATTKASFGAFYSSDVSTSCGLH